MKHVFLLQFSDNHEGNDDNDDDDDDNDDDYKDDINECEIEKTC